MKRKKKKRNAPDFETILKSLPGHVYWLDSDNIFWGCNEEQAKTVGLSSPDEIVGRTIPEFQTPANAEHILKINEEVLTTGISHVAEEPYLRRDGKVAIYLSHKSPIINKKGKIIGLLGVSFDITDIKLREQELIDAERQSPITYQTVLRLLPGHIYWKNRDGVILGCNQAQAKTLGFDNPDEIIGKTDYDITEFDVAESIHKMDLEIMNSGIGNTQEEIFIDDDGKELIYLSKKEPWRDYQGNIIGVLGVSFDITLRKEAEKAILEAKKQAEIADRAKSDFINNMKHDIRTPLGHIVYFADFLKDSPEISEEGREWAKNITLSANRLLELVDENLQVVNNDTGSLPIVDDKFNLREIVDKDVELLRVAALQKRLDLSVFYDKNIPQILIGDPVRVSRIIINLLSNALKFTEKGYVKISINEIKRLSVNKIIVEITIEDSGIGISEYEQKLVFVPFTRLTSSNTNQYKGLGLGLTIVKQFVHDLGGEIELKSQPHEGTRISCILPFKISIKDDSYTFG